jgi:hypothetical protein
MNTLGRIIAFILNVAIYSILVILWLFFGNLVFPFQPLQHSNVDICQKSN